MKLEFHPVAEQEFLESVSRYEAEVPGLGERFDAEVHERRKPGYWFERIDR